MHRTNSPSVRGFLSNGIQNVRPCSFYLNLHRLTSNLKRTVRHGSEVPLRDYTLVLLFDIRVPLYPTTGARVVQYYRTVVECVDRTTYWDSLPVQVAYDIYRSAYVYNFGLRSKDGTIVRKYQ